MRLRTTAAVFAGALALVLPTAGPSLADDHDGRGIGTLHYRLADGRTAQIRPADNDTCYVLTHASEEDPAVDVVNDTESLAVLFDNRTCDGRAERTLRPGERARGVEAVSVFFKPVEGRGDWHGGDGEGRGDWNGGEGGDGAGRGDWNGGEGGDGAGRGDWNGGEGGDGGDGAGRGDWNEGAGRDDQGRGDQAAWDSDGEGQEDLFGTVFRAIG
ncbi:hypothetical protein [Streptomyces sp. NPDC088762]|uniref:hypothetical protein n=1 Tax=Streptomyces sp. NPDC088762 TaxID=3365891 RepID=UPI0038000362